MSPSPLPVRQLRTALGSLRAARAELEDLDVEADLGAAMSVLECTEDRTRLLADHVEAQLGDGVDGGES